MLLWICISSVLTSSFFIGPKKLDINQSQNYCEANDSNLASIHSIDDQNIAKSVCDQHRNETDYGCWIGLTTNSEAQYTYFDKTTVNFGFDNNNPTNGHPWMSGEPNGNTHCVRLHSMGNFSWADTGCTARNYPLCNSIIHINATSFYHTTNNIVSETSSTVTISTTKDAQNAEMLVVILTFIIGFCVCVPLCGGIIICWRFYKLRNAALIDILQKKARENHTTQKAREEVDNPVFKNIGITIELQKPNQFNHELVPETPATVTSLSEKQKDGLDGTPIYHSDDEKHSMEQQEQERNFLKMQSRVNASSFNIGNSEEKYNRFPSFSEEKQSVLADDDGLTMERKVKSWNIVANRLNNVRNWLKAVGQPQYFKNFVNHGYKSLQLIKHINNANKLYDMGVRVKEHQIVLLDAIEALRLADASEIEMKSNNFHSGPISPEIEGRPKGHSYQESLSSNGEELYQQHSEPDGDETTTTRPGTSHSQIQKQLTSGSV